MLPQSDINDNSPAPMQDIGQKFDTCKFRSEAPEERTINRCKCQGGPYVDSGYTCSSRGIFKVTKEVCEICAVYEPK